MVSAVATKLVHKLAFAGGVLLVIVTSTALLVLQNRLLIATVGGKEFEVAVADTDNERQRGLSGRANLASDHGMLFVFDQSDRHCMWMKDMKFAIDMVWLDDSGVVVEHARGVGPETYPKIFCNDTRNARYVIELPSGSTGPLLGSRVSLPTM